MADAAVSVLVIAGLLLARGFGWLWMDPLAGIIVACVIASWSYALIRDTAAILLDMNPDKGMANRLREEVEADGDTLSVVGTGGSNTFTVTPDHNHRDGSLGAHYCCLGKYPVANTAVIVFALNVSNCGFPEWGPQ